MKATPWLLITSRACIRSFQLLTCGLSPDCSQSCVMLFVYRWAIPLLWAKPSNSVPSTPTRQIERWIGMGENLPNNHNLQPSGPRSLFPFANSRDWFVYMKQLKGPAPRFFHAGRCYESHAKSGRGSSIRKCYLIQLIMLIPTILSALPLPQQGRLNLKRHNSTYRY